MDGSALVVDAAYKRFGDATALDGLTLTARVGHITAVLGPNGAGKTTLLRCATGVVELDAGSISVLGRAPDDPDAHARIGMMPQSAGAWRGVTVSMLLSYLAKLYAHPQPVDQLIEMLGIGPFADSAYRRLSGGQQQSVNLAAALVGRPELVVLDEPTAGMDPHVRRRTWSIISSLRDDGVAVVLTTHSMDEAERLADQVYIVDAGRVAVSGTVDELTANTSLEDVFIANTTAETPT